MKMFMGLFSLVLSFASMASSGETKTFVYDGTQNYAELILRGEKTHTEYRHETRTITCYRTEMVGTRTVCTGGPMPGPGYPMPRPYPGGMCRQEPIYRQVAYPCQTTVQVPYQVKDFDVNARVVLDVKMLPHLATPGEKFVVTLKGDDLSISAVGSKKFLLALKKQNQDFYMNGSVKMMNAFYGIELIEALPVINALKMTSITLDRPVLSFNIGPVENDKNIGFALSVHRKKFGGDTVLFNRSLDQSEVSLNLQGAQTVVSVDINKLGVYLSEGKFALRAQAFFKHHNQLMNSSQFGDDLFASRTLLYKIR